MDDPFAEIMTEPVSVGDALAPVRQVIGTVETVRPTGRVTGVVGLTVVADGPGVRVGEACVLESLQDHRTIPAEVIGFDRDRVLIMPLGDMSGIGPGWVVCSAGERFSVGVGESLLGRVVDGLGRPIDGGPEPADLVRRPVHAAPPAALDRPRVTDALATGVRSIDAFATLGKGQRIGIFSGSGVGKSTLLGMICRHTSADINVIGLIGERGKEVNDFLQRNLGDEGLARSVVVVCTSDQPALVRLKATFVATAIAEYFRDRGADVMLMIDSITRWALAQREVGLAAGEPPTTRGYPPSVFATMPRLLERAGRSAKGSITGVYTILVEGDDLTEPITDTARSILDGHVVLSRELADRHQYPAIDVLGSLSRSFHDVVDGERIETSARARGLLSTYQDAADLIAIGAYKAGSSAAIDEAIAKHDDLGAFLRQSIDEAAPFDATWDQLREIVTRETVPIPAAEDPASEGDGGTAAPSPVGAVQPAGG